MEKLSVIIPAYCAEKYLAEAVESVRRQDWPGTLEVIIVDDGSEDGTFAAAQELGDIALKKARGGAASARNVGLRVASGDFIMLLDADDVLTSGALAALYAPFGCRPELTAVFGKAQDFISPELTQEQRKKLLVRSEYYGGVLPGCALLRKEIFVQIGFFDERLNSGETVAWLLKLRDEGLPVVSLEEVTLNRRLHLTNTGRVRGKQELQDYAAILRRRRLGK